MEPEQRHLAPMGRISEAGIRLPQIPGHQANPGARRASCSQMEKAIRGKTKSCRGSWRAKIFSQKDSPLADGKDRSECEQGDGIPIPLS